MAICKRKGGICKEELKNKANNGKIQRKIRKKKVKVGKRNDEEKEEQREVLKEAVRKWKKENEDERGNMEAKLNKRGQRNQ